jgi:hypothetical protein
LVASVIRLLAIVGGVGLLRGVNWARWLVVVWLGYHVGLSVVHSVLALVVHGLLAGTMAALLFTTKASEFFKATLPRDKSDT